MAWLLDIGAAMKTFSHALIGLVLAGIFLPLNIGIVTPPTPSFFVAPSPLGSDSNNGLSRSAPFLTLTKAQTAMRASGTILTTTLMSGTTAITSPVQLTSADSGQTWQGDLSNAYNAAVVDGSSTVEEAFCVRGGSNITFNNFKIQNVNYIGVMVHGGVNFGPNTCGNGGTIVGATNVTVKNMEIFNVLTPSQSRYSDSGCVVGQGKITGLTVDHIYCHQAIGMGIRASTEGGSGDDMSNTTISNNYILQTMMGNAVSDGGPMYIQDYTSVSTNITITNNFARDYPGGPSATQPDGPTHCMYIDAAGGNATVTNNICGPPGTGGFSTKNMVIMLCGLNNHFNNNLLDLGTGTDVSLINYGTCGAPAVLSAMTNNQFQKNIVVANFSSSTLTTTFAGQSGQSFMEGGTIPAFPAISGNTYFNYGGGAIYKPDGTNMADATRQLVDPGCSTTTGYDYVISPSSPARSSPTNWVDPPGGWGPPGFVIPAIGTQSSCP